MSQQAKNFVAGHGGMVGLAMARQLLQQVQTNIVTRPHAKLDLADQTAVRVLLHSTYQFRRYHAQVYRQFSFQRT